MSGISDMFFRSRKTSVGISLSLIPALINLLGYFWFLTTDFTSLNLAVLILPFSTTVGICWPKRKCLFLEQGFGWFELNGTYIFTFSHLQGYPEKLNNCL